MTSPARLCRGCDDELPPKHLRTQLAPPDSRWHEVRTHDVMCLLDYLEREEERLDDGEQTDIDWSRTTPSRRRPAPRARD